MIEAAGWHNVVKINRKDGKHVYLAQSWNTESGPFFTPNREKALQDTADKVTIPLVACGMLDKILVKTGVVSINIEEY